VISPVSVRGACVTFFLDVVHVAVGGKLAVPTDDAATAERCEPEESNKATHNGCLHAAVEQFSYPHFCPFAATEE
jgi:hypothetical protein